MFAVFGVCRSHCLARARRITKSFKEVDGRRQPLSLSEYEAAVAACADDLFKRAKPKKISDMFTAPSAAYQFKSLAENSGEARAVTIQRRDYLRRNGIVVNNAKTKKPRFTWVPTEGAAA